ncbi:MAG TPA: hypothetical protein VMH26_21195 [Burkholderiales bacterium]|nr:hypothetical protein [Burkholderiales bacterium]
MFALSPRVWMLVGLGVALVAAFFAGVKVESKWRDAALLEQRQKYDKEVDAVRAKERQVQEQTAKALEDERTKNQALSVQIQQAMKQAEMRGGAIQVKCPKPAPPRPAAVQVKADTTGPKLSGPDASNSPTMPAQPENLTAAATDGGASSSPSLAPVGNPTEGNDDDTTGVSMDDRIFFASFIGLYNTAITRQPERLPQASGGAHGGDTAASPVSGRDIIENLDENGKRFAECREKLKAWQNWARTLDLAK